MDNTPTFAGGCHWGVASTGITGFGKLKLNGTSLTVESDTATATDGDGYVVVEANYNQRQTANLECWISGSTVSGAVTITDSDYPQPGAVVTLTDAVSTDINGKWIAGSPSVSRGQIAKVTVPLHRFARMTL
jgi:hypothetical protein